MKKIFLLLIALSQIIQLNAQVTKSVEVTPGNLNSLLTESELSTATNLTLTGTIDARDFRTMRDSMPNLTQLDISDVAIDAYSGEYGTGFYPTLDYQAGEIPEMAFNNKSSLTTVVLPASATAINEAAFQRCSSLSSIIISPAVTRIGPYAFIECSSLTSITIPSTITTINKSTFSGCTALASFIIPNSVTTIGERAFYGCISMASVSIPSSVTSIGDYAFTACFSFTSLTIPSSVTSIGYATFSGLTSLTSLSIPSSVTSIGIKSFEDCRLLTSIVIPSSVTSIGVAAFIRCSNLTSIALPPSITSISEYTFSGCEALDSIVIPSSVTSIRKAAFKGCTNLVFVQIPSSVTRIDEDVFSNCSSLTEVNLPSSITFLGDRVFSECLGLKSVYIPPSVNRIGRDAFYYCNNLKSIYMNRSVPVPLDTIGLAVWSDSSLSEGILHVPYGSKALYAAAPVWKDFKNIVEDAAGFMLSANTIWFEVNGGQMPIHINSTIPWEASADQPWLSITPASGNGSETLTVMANINDLAINRTAKITVSGQGDTAQIINVNQKSTQDVMAVTAGNLSSLFTKDELDTITRLTLSGSINVWDINSIQKEMPLLTYLDLSMTTMKGSMGTNSGIIFNTYFYPDNWMPGPTIDFDPRLEDVALNKPLLKELKLPSELEVIGAFAFIRCSGLTTIIIPPTVKQIGYWAFQGCTQLHTIILPESLVKLADQAFADCKNIDTIYSYNPYPPNAFGTFSEDIKSTCRVYVPKGSGPLYAAAVGWNDFKNIVEMGTLSLSDTTLLLEAGNNSSGTIQLHSDISWHASSDQQWLTITPASGDASQILTFIAQANPADSTRMAKVTVSVPGAVSQTIIITQKGMTTGLDEIDANTIIKCFPNPFTQQMSIEIANLSKNDVSVDILSMTGLKIKSLARAQKQAKISCTWDGTNEAGKKMPFGIYLLKINEVAKQVVFSRY